LPLKRHEHFNLFKDWKQASSVILTLDSIQFTFETSVSKKKVGSIIGLDPGAKTLLTTDEGVALGQDMWGLLLKLQRKTRNSKAWLRCKEEIKEYVDLSCKQLPWESLRLVVLENNKKIKNKMKQKGKLSKKVRSILAGWISGRVDNRIQMLSECNGVALRRAPAFYNSTTCPSCSHCEKANRVNQAEFRCKECGYTLHADQVGALNSLARLALGPYGAEFKTEFLTRHPNYGLHKKDTAGF